MPRIYTEIRISHKTEEEKKEYEKKLDEALKAQGYKSRTEWLNEKYRELINCDVCKYNNCIDNVLGKCGNEQVKKDKTKCDIYYKNI